MKGKRGLSEVITTVLIILLVLAAVVIVWGAVKTTVQGGADQLTAQSKCMGVDLSIGTITGTSVEVTRNAGGDPADLTPVILVKGVVKSATGCTALAELESVTCSGLTIAVGDEVTVGGTIGGTACPNTAKKSRTV